MKNIRPVVSAVLATALALGTTAAAAQAWPSRPVRLVVPFPPGGGTDVVARLVADGLTRSWGQPVLVDNRGGASGTIGSDFVAKSAADGYTVLVATLAANVVATFVYPKLGYGIDSFAPVVMLTTTPNILLVNSTIPPKNLRDLIDYARARKGQLSYASPGIGLSGHLGMELFASAAGIELLHVPHKGSAPSVQAFIGGQVNLVFDLLPTSIAHVRGGQATPIALAAARRAPQLPDVPTFAELGLAGVEAYTWNALAVPSGTPREIVQRMNRDAIGVLNSSEVRPRLDALGADPIGGTPEELAAQMRREAERWGPVVKRAGVRADQ